MARRERFADALARGRTVQEAFRDAGFSTRGNSWPKRAYALRRCKDVEERVAELREQARRHDEAATERAIERLALTKEALARELLPLARSNIADFVHFDPLSGTPALTLSDATSEQTAAIKTIHVKTQKLRSSGSGAETGQVLDFKLLLHDKIAAAMAIARMFGWITEAEKQAPPTPLGQRLRAMTPEQRAEFAKDFIAQTRQRLEDLRQYDSNA